MISNNIKSFILINIYLLIIINSILLIAIYYKLIKTRAIKNLYEKTLQELTPDIYKSLAVRGNIPMLKEKIKSSFKKRAAIDILDEYSENNDADISEIVKELELDSFLINKIKRRPNIKYLKKLSFMRVDSAYEILLKNSDSEDMDIRYTSYFGLSMLKVDDEKENYIIQKLIRSDILSDRIIEILNRVDIKFEKLLDLLDIEDSETGKIILLKTILERDKLNDEKNTNKLAKFLYDTKEVRIAAVSILCKSKNEKYLDELYRIFKNEQEWEVKAAIAKGMANFEWKNTKDKLLYMIHDKEWWVRFNAAKSISLAGEDGIYTLIDLSVDKNNDNISALAYYFLNSNKDIYETVKNIEV
jgi:hypothetical protein